MKKKSKSYNGITLISLVVTIIILIILTGVSISAILGADGLITIARKAKKNIEFAIKDEEEQLNVLEDYMINEIEYKLPNITDFIVKKITASNIEIQIKAKLSDEYEFYISENENDYNIVDTIKANKEEINSIETIDYIYNILDSSEDNKTYYLKVVAKNRNGEDIKIETATVKFKDAFSGLVNGYSSANSTHADTYFPLNIENNEMSEYFTYSNNIITFKKNCIIKFEGQMQRANANTNLILGYYLNMTKPVSSSTSNSIYGTGYNNNLCNFNHTLSVNPNDYIIIIWKAMHITGGNAASSYQGKIDLKIKILEI